MRLPKARHEKLCAVSAVVCQVDGVLTTGALTYGPDGVCLRSFHSQDQVGFRLAAAAGWPTAILSDVTEALSQRWAADLGVVEAVRSQGDQAACLRAFLKSHQLSAEQVCYLGADLLDLPAMTLCGLSAAPADAAVDVRRRADLVLESPGGRGALRELVDLLLEAQERTEQVQRAYYAANGVDAADLERVLGAANSGGRIGFQR